MKIEVRQIEFESQDYFQSLGLRYEVLRRPLALHFDINELKKEGSDIRVAAFFNSQLIGCLILSEILDKPNVYKMRQVAVSDNFQRKAIGKQMVEFCERLAVNNGMNSIELNARENAVPFYLSLDYKVLGNSFLEVNIPHYKMTKELDY